MDVYLYKAAIYCADCGDDIAYELRKVGKAPADLTDESSYDSGDYPKGPYPDGGGEADCPQHCDGCRKFLENPLTTEGVEYTREAVAEARRDGRCSTALTVWAVFYGINPCDQCDAADPR